MPGSHRDVRKRGGETRHDGWIQTPRLPRRWACRWADQAAEGHLEPTGCHSAQDECHALPVTWA